MKSFKEFLNESCEIGEVFEVNESIDNVYTYTDSTLENKDNETITIPNGTKLEVAVCTNNETVFKCPSGKYVVFSITELKTLPISLM